MRLDTEMCVHSGYPVVYKAPEIQNSTYLWQSYAYLLFRLPLEFKDPDVNINAVRYSETLARLCTAIKNIFGCLRMA